METEFVQSLQTASNTQLHNVEGIAIMSGLETSN